jgi:SIR2-like domain
LLASYDLFKAAESFLYKKANYRPALDQLLRREIGKAKGPPPIHSVIAQLEDIYTVLTTNYDCLFEEACKTYQREVFKHVHEQFKSNTGNWRCKANLGKGQLILHKMHGCEQRDESMIITRADYIRYLANWRDPAKGMPTAVSSRLPSSTLVFLGYSVADWDLLTIWEGIVASYPQGGDEITSFAVLKSVSQEDRQFLQRRSIEPIERDLTEFAIALARAFKLEIPQLGIPKR